LDRGKLTIGGQPALEYEITGAADNLKLCYLHTTVELGGYFHQVIAWTLSSRCRSGKPQLRQIVESFRLAAKTPPADPE
jgi:hypothetical protein